MTYITRRGGTFHFRFRLPDDLRGREVPQHWPQNLDKLVNQKQRKFKHELTESLRTSEYSAAKARAGVLVSDTELLVREARRFLSDGPPRTISDEVIAYLAERRLREVLAADDAFRAKGVGLDLTAMRAPYELRIPVEGQSAPPPPPLLDPARGMTRDDLGLLDFAVDRFGSQLRLAVALRQPPDWIRAAVDAALAERGIALPQGAERERLDFQFLGATQKAFDTIKKRNVGEFIITPPPPVDPAEKHGPTLSETFKRWKSGTLLPGMKVPRPSTADEAEFCVRRFREMHGDPHIGSITRAQARSFCDALWRLPTRLPDHIERLPLPDIINRADIHSYPARSSGTFGKHITLMLAIINKGAKAFDLKFKGNGWSNPFDGLKPENNDDERVRDPFSPEELATIFGSSIYTRGERPRGGQGEAAFWLPVLDVMTGARLSELAQLRLGDIRKDDDSGIVFFDINDEGGKKLKAKSAKREVPIHRVLIDIGFMDYLAMRQEDAADAAALLFPGLEPRGKKQQRWAGAWSKWFNRWRTQTLGIAGHETRKDFHSLRHTFKDMCRAAQIGEEVHDALSGHSFKGGGKGVGRRYGSGVPLAVRAEAINRLSPPSVVAKLRWTRSAASARGTSDARSA